MYCLTFFSMSRAALSDAAQYTDEAPFNEAAGSFLLASADCSLVSQISPVRRSFCPKPFCSTL